MITNSSHDKHTHRWNTSSPPGPDYCVWNDTNTAHPWGPFSVNYSLLHGIDRRWTLGSVVLNLAWVPVLQKNPKCWILSVKLFNRKVTLFLWGIVSPLTDYQVSFWADIDLGQYWFRLCVLPEGSTPLPAPMLTNYQCGLMAYTWGANSQEELTISILDMSLRMTNLNLHTGRPGAKELQYILGGIQTNQINYLNIPEMEWYACPRAKNLILQNSAFDTTTDIQTMSIYSIQEKMVHEANAKRSNGMLIKAVCDLFEHFTWNRT